MLKCLAIMGLVASTSLIPQASPPAVLRGSWVATSQKQVLRGVWSAQLSADAPNAAIGSWAILSTANQIVLQGTWSAEKSLRGWEGTWTARTSTPSGGAGESFSGTWQASLKDFEGRNLADMLRGTMMQEIAGTWSSKGLSGSWSLKGSPS